MTERRISMFVLDAIFPAVRLITGIITIVAGIVIIVWPKVIAYLIIVGLLAVFSAFR